MRQFILNVAADGTPSVGTEILAAPPPVKKLLNLRGMNLAGGGAQSAWSSWGPKGPVSGHDYQFMSPSEVDALIAAGANTFRLLFTWEALQPEPWASVINSTDYCLSFHSLVKYITSKGCSVLLDVHGGKDAGFAAYYDNQVGKSYQGAPVSDLLENLWWNLASVYQSNPLVMYGITNEPHDIDPGVWYSCVQNIVNSIRKVGARSRIWVPGIDWTGAGTWMTQNAAAYNIVDPLNNTGIQLHLYLDANSGGGSMDVVSKTIGSERCKAVTEWARAKGLKLFLAEVGLSANVPNGKGAWDDLVAFMTENSDVWEGFTFWAAGPPLWWSGYQFYCGPGSAQLAMISGSLKRNATPFSG